MNYLQAIILAIVEGITEFLPISSTAHMKFTNPLIGITNSPLTHCTQLITGGAANYEMVSDPNYDALANKVIAATTQDGYLQAVEDLNKLVAQQHYAISLLSTNTFSVYQPWRKGYTGQWGENYTTGFGNLGFYESRFWIDQKLKTSLGH